MTGIQPSAVVAQGESQRAARCANRSTRAAAQLGIRIGCWVARVFPLGSNEGNRIFRIMLQDDVGRAQEGGREIVVAECLP
jgi:hypothetical protein